MMGRRQSEEINRAARRMAEAAEEMSRSVARLAENEAAERVVWERITRYLEFIGGAVEEGGSVGPWRIVAARPSLSEEDAVLLAIQSVREVREELWSEHETEVPAPGQEDIERWVQQREDRREKEGYYLR
jgi:hypothetical protein